MLDAAPGNRPVIAIPDSQAQATCTFETSGPSAAAHSMSNLASTSVRTCLVNKQVSHHDSHTIQPYP